MSYDYERYNEIILKMLEVMWRDPDALEIGEDISDLPEVKIIFDGYGDLEDEDENGHYRYTEGGNKNMESYAIFLHEGFLTEEEFVFPEHELTPWALIHRPKEEVCFWVWYDIDTDEVTVIPFEDNNSTELDHKFVTDLIQAIHKRDNE